MSWNTKSMRYFESLGFIGQVVEHWNAFSGKRKDYLGCVDMICLNPNGTPYKTEGIQLTSRSNISARWRKISDEFVVTKDGDGIPNPVAINAKIWLKCGNGLIIVGWDNEKAKDFTGKIRRILLDENDNFYFEDTNIGDKNGKRNTRCSKKSTKA